MKAESTRLLAERLRRFMALAPTANAILARDGTVVLVNPAFTRLLGYTQADIPHIDAWWPLAYPDPGYRADRQAAWNARVAEAATRDEEVHRFPGLVTCADGSQRWIETAASFDGDEIFLAMTDLTDYHHAQVALAKEAAYSDALLGALGDAHVGLYTIEHGRLGYVNRALCAMLGRTEEEVLAFTSFAEVVHADDRAMVVDRHRRRLAGEALPTNYDVRLATADGRERYANVSVTRMDHDVLLVAFVDATARILAMREMGESQLQFITLAESSSEGIFIHDRGRILLANGRAGQMLGLAPDSLLGRMTLEFIVPGHDAQVSRHLGIESGEARYETRIRRADGSEFPGEISSRPTRFQGHEVRIAALRDITDWKLVREQLEASRDEAVRARQAEAHFFTSISHELRTPLHSVIGFADLGKEASADRPDLARYFDRIRSSGGRQLALVDELLDIARLEAGKMDFAFSEVDLGDLIQALADEVAPQLAARRQTLALDLVAATVRCDRHRIGQVLRNLLSNALKFGADGDTIVVRLGWADASRGTAARIDVGDHGVGIPPDELESIFERFHQSSRTRTGAGGTGLGLAICREIIGRHGGKLWAANNPDGGATLSLLLPIHPGEQA